MIALAKAFANAKISPAQARLLKAVLEATSKEEEDGVPINMDANYASSPTTGRRRIAASPAATPTSTPTRSRPPTAFSAGGPPSASGVAARGSADLPPLQYMPLYDEDSDDDDATITVYDTPDPIPAPHPTRLASVSPTKTAANAYISGTPARAPRLPTVATPVSAPRLPTVATPISAPSAPAFDTFCDSDDERVPRHPNSYLCLAEIDRMFVMPGPKAKGPFYAVTKGLGLIGVFSGW